MAGTTRLSALALIAAASITATSILPITSDVSSPTLVTDKISMAQLRTAVLGGGTGYATDDVLSMGATPPATGLVRLDGGTVTTSAPLISAVQTWNASGVVFTGMKLNVTNTASAAGSLLLDLQIGGTSKFSVDKAGTVTLVSGSTLAAQAVTATTLNTLGDVTIGTANGSASHKLYFPYTTSADSRTWRILTDEALAGDYQIQQSTTQTGSTYATKFYISPSGVVTIASGAVITAGGILVSAGTSTFQDVTLGSTSILRFGTLQAVTSDGSALYFGQGACSSYIRSSDISTGTPQKITAGANDSGGSGFRVLRIPN